MPDKIIGVTVGATQVYVVLLTKNGPDSFTLEDETTLNLQAGERPAAYSVLHRQFYDYVHHHDPACVCIKGSAVSLSGTTLAHLQAAELRGVVEAAAAAASVSVRVTLKSVTSRTFGTRKVDEYLKDNAYWQKIGLNGLKKGMREAAFTGITGSTT